MSSHLYRRGTVWHAWIYVGGVQVRRSTRCTDRRAAESVLREWERDAADPARASAHYTTVNDALTRLFADREAKGRASGTVTMYRSKARHVVRILGALTPLHEVDAREIDRYVDERLAEGAARTTIHKELTTIRAALRVARRRGEYTRDVDAVMPDGFSAEYKPKVTFLSRRQLDRLLAVLEPGRAARVAWIVATASRWSESDRARREDVGALTVAIRGTKTTSSEASVPILADVRDLLDRALRDADGDNTLFRAWGSVRRDLHAACERAERDGEGPMPRVSPNDLRRSLATWLRQAGVSPQLIGSMLRHRDSRMVERVYGRMPPQDLGAAIERDTGVIGPGGFERSQRPKRRARIAKSR